LNSGQSGVTLHPVCTAAKHFCGSYLRWLFSARFEVLTAVLLEIQVFWDVTLSQLRNT